VNLAAQGMVIIGAGQAGVQVAESLRAGGYAGAITLLGDELYPPYHRPPLSKAWLAGEIDAAQLTLRAPEALARKNITLRTGASVSAIDTTSHTVTLSDGSVLPYGGLALATGATPRALPVPGADADGVLALRTRDDASAIVRHLQSCAEKSLPVVVIGGGFIGLEVAATARKRGLAVTVLEAAPRLLGRVLAPLLSDWYAQLHTGHGVGIVFNAQVSAIDSKDGHAAAVTTADGRRFPAGLVIVGIGVSANDSLARIAGIACDRGIIVDTCARTSVPNVAAAGDCTARRLPDGSLLRLESVQNATEQGRSAAAALLGQERPFVATPWFWSDQYDKKLQMAGLSSGADHWVVRGVIDAGTFSVCHFRGGQLIAVDSVNASKDHLLARKLLDAGVSPTLAQTADTTFDLAELLAK
jgi:3-phenylpropionate/trans-cinnamate dioxygenase ferredoxin reductase component